MCFHQPVTFNDAEKEYNSSKNRFPDKLPSELALHIMQYCVIRLYMYSHILDAINNNIEINVKLFFCLYVCSGDGYRVRLRSGPVQGSDYINASFVNVTPPHTTTALTH